MLSHKHGYFMNWGRFRVRRARLLRRDHRLFLRPQPVTLRRKQAISVINTTNGEIFYSGTYVLKRVLFLFDFNKSLNLWRLVNI
jgi:hypothetical protein